MRIRRVWALALAIRVLVIASDACSAAPVPVPPGGVTGLALWLDAAQLTGLTNGATVNTWNDLSGSGNNATLASGAPTYQTNAINAKPVVRFKGYQVNMPGGHFTFPSIPNVRTVFWVVKKTPGSHLRFLLGDDTEYHFHAGVSTLWDAPNVSPNILGGTTRIMGAAINGTTTALPEGSFQLISVVTSGDVQVNTLSQDRSFAERTWEGDIAEILIYPRALTSTEETAVGSYLANKYRLLTTYLPATFLSFGTNVVCSSAAIGLPVGGAATITWTVPYGTTLARLAPTFSLSSGTCNWTSGVIPSPNFNAGPVTYTVTSTGTTNTYTVTAVIAPPSAACDMKGFNANLAGSRSTIMPAGTVVVNIPAGTTETQLAALSPSLTLSPGATCVMATPPLRSTAPVHYIVTAQDGITTRDYTVTTTSTEGDFRLFIVKTKNRWLAGSDYDYLSLIPVSKHVNKGSPAIFAVASTNDFITNVYFQDYLRRYHPALINTINFTAAIPDFASSTVTADGPLELSVAMATNSWVSAGSVVLVSDSISKENYPNVLQASALASALDAPLIYYNSRSDKKTFVQNAIRQLGAPEVIYVNAAGTKPALATRVLKSPADIVKYLDGKGIEVDYFAAANPLDLTLVSGAKLSLTAPFIAARRTGIVVPITSYVPVSNTTERFHHSGYALISSELRQLFQDLGRYPDFLALVGNATSIPLSYSAVNTVAGDSANAPSDFDYSNVDADLFPDIAIGRIMAYNIFDATLYACRISTYEHLFDGVWERTTASVGGACDSAYQAAQCRNYGFTDTNWCGREVEYRNGRLEASIIGHNDHSSYHVVGGAWGVTSSTVLAPALITSEGCATAAIDFETLIEDGLGAGPDKCSDRGEGLLVVNRLFKLGAVSFLGCPRSATGADKMMQSRAVNALLAGEPLGRCYMAGVDVYSMDWQGDDDQRRNWILLGDPGLTIHVPSNPVVAPAGYAVTPASSNTAVLTVNIPSSLFASEVDSTWCAHWVLKHPQYWGDKPGLYGMDVDRFYMVRFTPQKTVLSVEDLGVWTNVNTWVWGDIKLGMMGAPSLDYRQDGTTQLVWAIRANIMDWAGSKGKVPLAQIANIQFRITYAPEK